MRKGGKGGAVASKSGSDFELKTQDELLKDLISLGYKVTSAEKTGKDKNKYRYINLIDKKNNIIDIYYQGSLTKYFFGQQGVEVKDIFSHSLNPDTAIYSHKTKVLTIIEKKQQNTEGSVAEKLQTCDYKMHYYTTLCKPLKVKVELVWQLGDYFKRKEKNLKSVFEYMEKRQNKLYFGKIDVSELNI